MRFLAGVVIGIVIGRPVLNVANDYLTPPVRRRIARQVHSLANRLHTYASNSPYLQENDK